MTLDEYTAAARPLNPDYTDAQIAEQYHAEFPSTPTETKSMPTLEEYTAAARPLNPDYGDEDIAAQYRIEFGDVKRPEPSGVMRRAGDVGIGVAKGIVDIPKIAVGIADIGTGGHVGLGAKAALDALGKDADSLGLPRWARPSQWSEMLSESYSPETQDALRGASEETRLATEESVARGDSTLEQIGASALGTAKGIAKHPGSLVPLVSENLPQMFALAKGVSLALKPLQAALDAKIAAGAMTAEEANTILGKAAIRASSVGEGLQAAGQVSSEIGANDPEPDFVNRLAAAAAGVGTSLITRGVGKIPGLGDAEATLATKMLGQSTGFTGGLPTRIGKGVLAEGVLQEPTQSAQEQIWTNVAEGKPWHTGVGEQAVQGAVVGGLIGGGAASVGKRPEEHVAPILQAPDVDTAITRAQEAVGDSPITRAQEAVGDSPITPDQVVAFIGSQKDQLDITVGRGVIDAQTETIEQERAADKEELVAILADTPEEVMGETTLTTDEQGNTFFNGSPVDVVHPTALPDTTGPDAGMSKEKYEVFASIASLFGLRVSVFKSAEFLPDGVVRANDASRTVFISTDTQSAGLFSTFIHEVFHKLEGTEFHSAVGMAIWENLTPEAKQLAIDRHGDLSHDALIGEMTSDIAGTELEKPELWEKVYLNLNEKVGEERAKTEMLSFIDEIKTLIKKVKTLITSRPWSTGFGANKKTYAEQYVKDLTKVHDALAAGVANAIYQTKTGLPGQGKIALAKRSSKASRAIVHPDTVKAFADLAKAQRGKPESAMFDVQSAAGGGVLGPVVEDTGDLIHRMTEQAGAGSPQTATLMSKINRSLGLLTNKYGFEKEIAENLRNNARALKRPVAEMRAEVDKALAKYAAEYKKLPVYNEAQHLAREASVAVGEKRFLDAVKHLKALKKIVESPDYEKQNFAYEREGYKPESKVVKPESKVVKPESKKLTTESKKLTTDEEKVVKSDEEKPPSKTAESAEKEEYDYASTQINLPTPLAKRVLAIGKQIETGDLAEKGLETVPHITVKYGLHSEDPKAVSALLASDRGVSASIGDIGMFATKDGDVLILKVVSPDLVKLNEKISTLPNTEAYPEYKPHITIAYVKTGLGKGYVRTLENPLEGQSISVNEIQFSNKKGEFTPIKLKGETGELYGPAAEKWKPFNEKFFLSPDKERVRFSKKNPLIGMSKAELPTNARVPLVKWDKDALRANAEQIKESWSGVKSWGKGQPTVYQSYVPIDEVPRARTPEIEGVYDWSEYKKSGVFPPITIVIHQNGIASKLEDGNHRARFWTEKGFTHFPAWIVDFRKVQVPTTRFSKKVWFSAMGNMLAEKMPANASVEQVRNLLKGAKDDEVKWTGINDYLDAQKGPVNKHNLLKWLETNDVQIKEVVKKERKESDFPPVVDIATFNAHWNADGNSRWINRDVPGLTLVKEDGDDTYTIIRPNGQTVSSYSSFNSAAEEAYELEVVGPNEESRADMDPSTGTQYEGYKLPGGEDYTELLLTLPTKTEPPTRKAYQLKNDFGDVIAQGDEKSAERWRAEGKTVYETDELDPKASTKAGNFQSTHFNEPNILAHVRFDTRKAGTGESVLFLEEVQSDWHEQGREKGYADPDKKRWVVYERNGAEPVDRFKTVEEAERRAKEIGGRVAQLPADSGVPQAPFSKTWPELVMKRMLRHGAEHNFDRLAWTTGAQQNERYGLAQVVERIEWTPRLDQKSIYLRIKLKARQTDMRMNVDENRVISNVGATAYETELAGKNLNDVVGKDVANKIMSEHHGSLTGDNLSIGGSGMKYFYDQMIPRFMEKYLKRFGTKVDALEIKSASRRTDRDTEDPDGSYDDSGDMETVHSIALTPEMKDSVINKGQPKFSRRNAVPTYPIDKPSKLDYYVRLLQDKFVDVRNLLTDIEKAGGTVPEQLNPVLAEEMFQKRDEQRAKDFTNDELRPLVSLMKLNKVTVKQLDEYLHARHVIDDNLNARLQAINPDLATSKVWDKLSGITDAEARKILSAANKPVMDVLTQHVDDMVETTRELMVHYGLEKQSTIDTWRQEYKRYVPLRREGFDGEGNETGMGKSVRGSTVKQRGGSGLAVENILANIAQARDQIVTRGEKNRVTVAMAGLQMLHPNPAIATLDKPARVTYVDPLTGLTMTVPGNLANYEVPTIRRFNPTTGKMQNYPDPTYKGRDNVVNFRIKGEDYAIVFNENTELAMEVAKAFKNLGTPQLNGIMKAVAPYTRYLAAVNTQYNPIFGLVNFVRDAQFAMLTLGSTPLHGKQATILKNALGSLAGIYQDARAVRTGGQANSQTARLWRRFEHVGGPTGYRDLFFSASERAEEIERMMDPSSWKGTYNPLKFGKRMEETHLFQWLSDYNLMMENSIRLGVFKTAVDNGMSDLLAASYAKNITVNFNKKGQIGAQMGSLYAFFNANVQGTARIAETLFERTPAGFKISPIGKKIIVGGLLVGVLQTMALALAGFDDDDPPEFVKQKNLVIPVPGTEKGYTMIPMPLGFNLLPNVGRLVSETMMNVVKGKPAHPFEKGAALFAAIFGTMSPLGGTGGVQEFAPTVGDPFVAIATNRDWTGKTIAKEDHSVLDPSPGHTRAKNTATAWAKALSYAINWATGGTDYVPGALSPSPDTIDYLVEQATGGVGREFSKAVQVAQSAYTGEELPTHKIPLVGRFVGSASGSASTRNRFFENVKASNLAYREFEGRALHQETFSEYVRKHPEARFAKAAKQVQDDVAILNKQKTILLKGGASREAIRLQEERITNLMGRFNSLIERAQEQAP